MRAIYWSGVRFVCINNNLNMPMHQMSTPNNADDFCRAMKKENVRKYYNPKKQTLSLILQFACSYHVEKKLPESLSGLVLN